MVISAFQPSGSGGGGGDDVEPQRGGLASGNVNGNAAKRRKVARKTLGGKVRKVLDTSASNASS
jgi:hypothetical protein